MMRTLGHYLQNLLGDQNARYPGQSRLIYGGYEEGSAGA